MLDKVFALCDYYLQGKSKRYSRHLYDTYKLTHLIEFNDGYRSKMRICSSADETVDVPAVILEFCDNSFYREDYQSITDYFAENTVPYDDVIGQMRTLAASNLFVK